MRKIVAIVSLLLITGLANAEQLSVQFSPLYNSGGESFYIGASALIEAGIDKQQYFSGDFGVLQSIPYQSLIAGNENQFLISSNTYMLGMSLKDYFFSYGMGLAYKSQQASCIQSGGSCDSKINNYYMPYVKASLSYDINKNVSIGADFLALFDENDIGNRLPIYGGLVFDYHI